MRKTFIAIAAAVLMSSSAWSQDGFQIAALAANKDCAAIRAFNATMPSRAAMKRLPCHCIPMSGRMDRVYSKPPTGMVCGNGVFYDKQCHEGMSCGPR